jgi:hypothetical protein
MRKIVGYQLGPYDEAGAQNEYGRGSKAQYKGCQKIKPELDGKRPSLRDEQHSIERVLWPPGNRINGST